jgi:hypothetical protein
MNAPVAIAGHAATGGAQVYTWANGFQTAVTAMTFKAAWDRLARKLGRPPEYAEIVEAAKQPRHPLHQCFEWDLEAAAMAHWVTVAGSMVRNLRVTYSQGPAINMPMRAIFRVQGEEEKTFISGHTALTEPDYRTQIMRQILGDIRAFVSKYRTFLLAIDADVQAAALEQAIAQAAAE